MLFSDSVPGQAFTRCLDDGTLVISLALAEELNDIFRREKFNRYVSLELRERLLAAMVRDSELIEITEKIQACRDPKDDRILEPAVNGRASTIVTGDIDLLVLNPFRGIQIVTPAGLLKIIDESSP